jgi:acid phosphatase
MLLLFIMTLGCSPKQDEVAVHELLNATLWVQTSAEYQATALQAYQLAELRLDQALEDHSWTAAQEQTGEFADLLPAIIVDVDETVLDNSPHEAQIIEKNTVFAPKTWDPWVEEARAKAVPGALKFCQYAADRGVTVFYVTNRQDHLLEATRRNLKALGFPLWTNRETIFPRIDNSDKGPRRAAIAREYRILLLMGDDARDFSSEFVGRNLGERNMLLRKFESDWGKKWIILPNPLYGDWEKVLYGDEGYKLERAQRLQKKVETLEY